MGGYGDFLHIENRVLDGFSFCIVRDDVFPFIGGGNKARKAMEYEMELSGGGYNAIVTTGGIQSNHNRAMALLAAKHGWKCHIVYHGSKERFYSEKGNALLVRKSGADVEFVDADCIGVSMDAAMEAFRRQGFRPYYVTGGGHDIPGGMAYVKAARLLYDYGVTNNYKPGYIFLASGTGSTQAGLIAGLEEVGWGDVKVVGISVARQHSRGKRIVSEFSNMLSDFIGLHKDLSDKVYFNADYLSGGYEQYSYETEKFLDYAMSRLGLVFDTTYSGKAFHGMLDYVHRNNIENSNILFWHTGGLLNIQK